MQQACADAEKFGIPFCHLGTNEREIPQEFLNSQKILITYVQKIFNGLSLFGIGGRSFHVGCIILDDSHACMDSILYPECALKEAVSRPHLYHARPSREWRANRNRAHLKYLGKFLPLVVSNHLQTGRGERYIGSSFSLYGLCKRIN